MKNRELVLKKLENLEYPKELGVMDDRIELLKRREMDKVLDALEEDYGDVRVSIRGEEHIVEMHTWGTDVDLRLLTKEDYENMYGRSVDE